MRPEQRKPVLMLANSRDADGPSADRVALLALRSHLPPVHVCMAGGALRSDVAKFEAHMARSTRDALVHAPQRKMRFRIVVELRRRSDRLPARGRVAILARDADIPVRVFHPPSHSLLCAATKCDQ